MDDAPEILACEGEYSGLPCVQMVPPDQGVNMWKLGVNMWKLGVNMWKLLSVYHQWSTGINAYPDQTPYEKVEPNTIKTVKSKGARSKYIFLFYVPKKCILKLYLDDKIHYLDKKINFFLSTPPRLTVGYFKR